MTLLLVWRRALWVFATCFVVASWLPSLPRAVAQTAALGRDGLGGGRHVGSARVDGPKLRGVASLGYAHTGDVLGDADSHERVVGELAAAWVARSWLQLSLRLEDRYDAHKSKAGRDSGFTQSPELSSRHAFQLSQKVSLAGQARVRFPSGSSVGRSFAATTTELAALLSWAFRNTGELTWQAGYRFDRTQQAFANRTLTAADAWATTRSRWDAALLGALVSVPVGSVTLIGEWSWEPCIGAGAPAPFKAPMRAEVSLQRRVGARLVQGGGIGMNISGRPTFDGSTPIEPRFWAFLSLGVYLDPKPSPKAELHAPPVPTEPKPAPMQKFQRAFLVLDPQGQPIVGASVTRRCPDESLETFTDTQGHAQLEGRLCAEGTIIIKADGYLISEQKVVPPNQSPEMLIQLERALPEGEIKGQVRSLKGGPLHARIEVLPGGQVLETGADGSFALTVAPGDYVLYITAPGHEPQQRAAQVDRHGVTILVVDLRRHAQ